MQLKDVLENIPLLLQYFIPGFVSVQVFYFFASKKSNEVQSKIIISAAVSYMLISITEIATANLDAIKDSVLMKSGVAVSAGIILAVLFALVFRSKCFTKLLVRFFNKTPNDDIWMDVLDFKQGSNLKIYEKGKDYYITGHHFVNEEKGNESWFAVTAYSKKTIQEDKIIEDYSGDEKAIFAVRLSDIDHMEIFN